MAQNISQDQLIDSWNLDQLMKSQLVHKKSNFDFLVNIKFQRSRFIKTFKNIKIDHQESRKSKKSTNSQDLKDLEKF